MMNDLAGLLISRFFPRSHELLTIGHVTAEQLSQQYGTPFYAYDAAILDLKYDALRDALPKPFEIYYSIKANPCVAVAKHLVKRGCGIDIASIGEYNRALEAGCLPDRILFAGPGKTETELDLVIGRGIGEIHVESRTELRRIETICRRTGRQVRIAIRINPIGTAEGGALKMGGRSAPFGIDEESIDEILDDILASNHISLSGIHMFAGTQILDVRVVIAQFRHGISLARKVAGALGRPLATVDFGGGLGIPYFSREHELDVQELKRGLAYLYREIEDDALFTGTRFIVEPGRFLAGEAGIYVTRITDVKSSRGKVYLIVDGGMNHHLAASGNLGQTIKKNYPMAIANKLYAQTRETVDITGPLCTPLDTLARDVLLPHAEIGDLIVIFQSGAYGRSASPMHFLGHSAPPEIWINSGRCQLVYRRGEVGEPNRPLFDGVGI